MNQVLLLAGTVEATRLAARLSGDHGIDVLSSLAGVTQSPRRREGRVRSGGFGGIEGLVAHLQQHPVDALIDATHPFAAVMPFHAHAAAEQTGTPVCRLLRPAWKPEPGDRWWVVPTLEAAALEIESLAAKRPLLTIGRRGVEAFLASSAWFLIRSIEPPTELPKNHRLLLDRGPFDFETEKSLMREHRIDVLVTKNSGGEATAAKLQAARELGLPVVIVQRPEQPPVPRVRDVEAAVAWLVRELAAQAK